ncbi:MAG: AbiJ-NTD4 domain-containing protein [Ignavibacteria bacterium]
MNFSQRMGLEEINSVLQIEGIRGELRNRIWSIIYFNLLKDLSDINYHMYRKLIRDLYSNYFKVPADEMDHTLEAVSYKIKQYILDSLWNKVFDILEFIIHSINEQNEIMADLFEMKLTQIFKEEHSGYRLLNKQFVPITNELEVNEILDANNYTKKHTALNGANIHISEALNKLSHRTKPDFRNSIKESISAVETTCRIITGESTLGDSLKNLNSKGLELNSQLKSGFENIYAYTNDKKSGIRHAIIEEHKAPDFEDAKYMLVVCCSFINYIVGKCVKLNIELKI